MAQALRSPPGGAQIRILAAEAALRRTLDILRENDARDAKEDPKRVLSPDAHALRMKLLHKHAKRVLRARLQSLKERIADLRGSGAAPESLRAAHLKEERKRTIEGGESAILIELGVPVAHCVSSVRQARAVIALDKAVCKECGASLVSFDPKEHGIETVQLGCSSCGGMFDLDVFIGPSGSLPL
jgi:hypothetical protein